MPSTRTMLVVPATLLAAIGAATSTAALADSSGTSQTAKAAQQAAIRGSWITDVAIEDAPPGVPSEFRALDTFTSGGGLVVSSSAPAPDTRSLAHGSWTRTGKRAFTSSFVWFRFDPTGASIGTQRVDRTMKLARDGRHFKATDVITIVNPAGEVVATLHATEVGRRLPKH